MAMSFTKVRNNLRINIPFITEIDERSSDFIQDRVIGHTLNSFYLLGSEKFEENAPSRKVDPFKIEIILASSRFILNLYESMEYEDIMHMVKKFFKDILDHNKSSVKGGVISNAYNFKLISEYATLSVTNAHL